MPMWRRRRKSPGDIPLTSAMSIGRTPFERRRRALTALFGFFVAILLFSMESRWPSNGLIREILFVSGTFLAAAGTLGRTWCHLFISGYKTRALVQVGPYSMCRNPLYLFSAIGMIGIGICSGTLTIPVVMVLFFATYYPWIIRCEEDRLEAKHPVDFLEYRRITPTFWPRLSGYCEPETYTMFPRIMRKNIVDGFWFIALAALVHVASELQEANVLPSLLKVW
jgi:protein-S-isoprenylcysteine O-methyltransferase Ste14